MTTDVPAAPVKPLSAGDRARIEGALPRVQGMAKGIHSTFTWMPADDLYGAGALRLTIITPHYEPAIHPEFAGFYYIPVRGEMFTLLRRDGRDRKLLRMYFADLRHGVIMEDARDSTDAFLSAEPVDERASLRRYLKQRAAALVLATHYASGREDGVPSAEQTLAHRELIARLVEAVAGLPEKERQVIDLLYKEELTLEDAGAKLGVSSRTVQRLHNAARERLERALRRRGVEGS